MTNIYSNGYLVSTENIAHVSNASYTFLNAKIYAANMLDRLYGVFISDIIQAPAAFLKWHKLSWNGQNNAQTKVFLFVRSASSQENLAQSSWVGPYQNDTNDISALSQPYLQFMTVLRNDAYASILWPMVNWVNISFFSAQAEVKFFTRAFDLDFTPKHLLLTYNATNVTDATIIRFAVSGEDTVDTSRYQYIDPNKMEKLNEIGYDARKLKIMLELIGTSGTPVSVDEFSVLLGGDGSSQLNRLVGYGIGYDIIGSTFVVGG